MGRPRNLSEIRVDTSASKQREGGQWAGKETDEEKDDAGRKTERTGTATERAAMKRVRRMKENRKTTAMAATSRMK